MGTSVMEDLCQSTAREWGTQISCLKLEYDCDHKIGGGSTRKIDSQRGALGLCNEHDKCDKIGCENDTEDSSIGREEIDYE